MRNLHHAFLTCNCLRTAVTTPVGKFLTSLVPPFPIMHFSSYPFSLISSISQLRISMGHAECYLSKKEAEGRAEEQFSSQSLASRMQERGLLSPPGSFSKSGKAPLKSELQSRNWRRDRLSAAHDLPGNFLTPITACPFNSVGPAYLIQKIILAEEKGWLTNALPPFGHLSHCRGDAPLAVLLVADEALQRRESMVIRINHT